MKRTVAIMLVLAIGLCMCACSTTTTTTGSQNQPASTPTQEETYTIYCNDGTVKKMTAKEILDMYNNDGRNFETLLQGALISGTGIVSSIGNIEAAGWTYPDKIPCAWDQEIRVADGKVTISTFFAPKDNYAKLYKGDKVVFQGTLSATWTGPFISIHYQNPETYLRYAG